MSDCILHKNKPAANGYVRLHQNKYAHRVAWEDAYGPIPDGLCVLHHCDVKNCINPEHLFLGTRGDNNRDRSAKGRTTRHNAKLSEAQVVEIRERWPQNSQRELADEFGVSQRAVGNLLRGSTYNGTE